MGKSNIFDAIAFALNLSLAPNKVRHVRDLAHRPISTNNEQSANQRSSWNPEKEFFVKLNFLKTDLQNENKVEKLSIQRGFKKRSQENPDLEPIYYNEYIVNENYDQPLLYEEYDRVISQIYNLKGPEFMIYQN